MKGRREPIDLLRDVFAQREMEVARRLGEFQATLTQAVEQLDLLREHRGQQVEDMRVGASTDPSRLQNQMAFMKRLNEAISQQELVIQRAENEREELKRRWMASRRKTQSVDKLSERRRDVTLREEVRAEQRQMDEFAVRSARANKV